MTIYDRPELYSVLKFTVEGLDPCWQGAASGEVGLAVGTPRGPEVRRGIVEALQPASP